MLSQAADWKRMLDGWVSAIVGLARLSPIWGALLGHVWDLHFRPRLISADEVRATASKFSCRLFGGFRRSHYRVWISTYRSTDDNEFRDIEPPLAKFELRHDRLPLPEAFAKFRLRYARVLSSLHQQFDYSPVKIETK